jgi:imidazolonepropionase-like amidohydrolase
VFDGERLTNDRSVLLDGATIGAGASADDVVDLDGATLLPGLIDTHQHLVFDGIGTFEEQVAPHDDDTLRTRAHDHARKALAAGITTLRDLGDRGYVTLDVRSADDVGTILTAGPPLTRRQGHCWFLGGEAEGEDELRAAVRARAERGCDAVKVMVTGGHGTAGFPMWESQYSTAEVVAVVDEARKVGLPVAAHCHGLAGIESALAAGVASIEHCTFIAGEEQRSMPTSDLLGRLAASSTGVSVSLGSLDFDSAPAFVKANMVTLLGAVGELVSRGGGCASAPTPASRRPSPTTCSRRRSPRSSRRVSIPPPRSRC